jgi:serine/threonine-protein kinase
MGEVYRATDTKLGRDVALKILPASFTNDPERVARFRREAQVLASLNHPHIAQIHGLEEVNGTQFLVLELVDGESLDKRIARGPIAVDEALGIAKQIAEALEAAHDKGIIHRDLKPANIALTNDGAVKVLDFGLAKAVESTGGSVDAMNSPTITSPAMMTGVGVILGTAAYMSPEQAKGRPADKRSDIWAFGCILYEMLTGRRPFAGEDISDTFASVLRAEPDWAALPAGVPFSLKRLLTRCVQKDPRRRLQAIGDARVQIEDLINGTDLEPAAGTSSPPARGPAWLPAVLATCVGMIIVGSAVWKATSSPVRVAAPVARWRLTLGDDQQFTNTARRLLSVSPDGTAIVYVANRRLYVRSMAELDARQVPGTDDSGATDPTFSPDGRWLVFFSNADRALKRIAVAGGAAVTVCQADGTFGISWNADSIFFGQGSKGIWRVPAGGGTAEVVATVKESEVAYGPEALPGGQNLLFAVATGTAPDRWNDARIVVQSLISSARRTLIQGGSDPRYLLTGHLVYVRSGSLLAVPFDITRLAITGGATPVVEGVLRAGQITGAAQFSVAATGTLVYIPGPVDTSKMRLAWIDRLGDVEALPLPVGPYEYPRIAPNGEHIAYDTDTGKDAAVWAFDVSGKRAPRQLTLVGRNRVPVWSPDSAGVAFQSDRDGDAAIFWQRVDGTAAAERLTTPERGTSHLPESWSPDGKTLLFSVTKGNDISLWSLSLPDKHVASFGGIHSGSAIASTFSPDGRWVAYNSSPSGDTGPFALLVQPFPPTGLPYRIANPGVHPLWSPNGQELFFHTGPSDISVVTISTRPTFTFSTPVSVPAGGGFERGPGDQRNNDITLDGKRFLAVVPGELSSTKAVGRVRVPQIDVVEHWFEELKARVPTK